MATGYSKTYNPDPERAREYQKLYEKYLQLGADLTAHLQNI